MAEIVTDSSPQNPNTQIPLYTRRGNKIDNIQGWELSHFQWSQLKTNLNRFGPPFVKFLSKDGCPVYNCHGLTFGSRRTSVEATNLMINRILDDDGFDEVTMKEVQEGDVIIYADEDGEIQHSGIVVEMMEFAGFDASIPRVWSKWGHGQETVHHFQSMPYKNVTPKYYRMRRWKP
jgi:hypothetical protein